MNGNCKIFAHRDYPPGCGRPPKKAKTDSVPFKETDTDLSNGEEAQLQTTTQSQENLQRNDGAKVYPPRARTSAVRTYPKCCAPATMTLAAPESVTLETTDLGLNPPAVEQCEVMGTEEESPSPQKLQSNVEALQTYSSGEESTRQPRNEGAKVYPPRAKIPAVRTYPKSWGPAAMTVAEPESIALDTTDLGLKPPGGQDTVVVEQDGGATTCIEREKTTTTMRTDSGSDMIRPFSGTSDEKQCEMMSAEESLQKQSQLKESPAHRRIVMALMAPRKCPWTQKKRISRQKKL